jgi:hypothetical protein
MKTLKLIEMESLLAGDVDCSTEAKVARLAGAAAGGALLFGWGALLTTFGMTLYNGFACNNQFE